MPAMELGFRSSEVPVPWRSEPRSRWQPSNARRSENVAETTLPGVGECRKRDADSKWLSDVSEKVGFELLTEGHCPAEGSSPRGMKGVHMGWRRSQGAGEKVA